MSSTTQLITNAPADKKATSIVGRGNKEGNRLFREWYGELTSAPERKEHSAYVFVMGSLAEILRSFDIHTIFPEINGLQQAVRHVADDYIGQAEDYGFSADVCGYVKADVGLQLRGGDHPMGKIPPPSLAVYTNACNTYVKWAEIWERMYHVPTFTLDIPGSRAAGDVEGKGRDVVHPLPDLGPLDVGVAGIGVDGQRRRRDLPHGVVSPAELETDVGLDVAADVSGEAVVLGLADVVVGNVAHRLLEPVDLREDRMDVKAAQDLGEAAHDEHIGGVFFAFGSAGELPIPLPEESVAFLVPAADDRGRFLVGRCIRDELCSTRHWWSPLRQRAGFL